MNRTLIPLMLLGAALGIAQLKPEVAFRAAMETETVKGDLKGAIEQYRKIAQGSDRALAARALLRMADCYAKLGQAEAEMIYRRVSREFADQPDSAGEAQKRLAARGGAKPETLAKRRLCSGCGDPYTSLSVDGRWMAFTDWDTGDLAIRDVATMASQRRLLKPGSWKDSQAYVEFPVLSPDLRQIAYLWDPGIDGRPAQLRIVANEPGAKPRVLLDTPENTYYEPGAWSPDGKTILTLMSKPDLTWQIAWVSVPDGKVTVLKSLGWRHVRFGGTRLRLSPDGRFIAYSALTVNPKAPRSPLGSAEQRIYILASDGSKEIELDKTAGINNNPLWTPDGKRLLFNSDRTGSLALWSVLMRDGKPAGSPSIITTDTGNGIGMTQSGTYYYALRSSGVEEVTLADLTPSSAPGIGISAAGGSGFVGIRPTWSPDGRMLAFTRRRPTGWQLVVQSLETGEETVYPFEGTQPSPPRWFHHGKALLVSADRPGKPRSLYRADLGTKEFTLIMEADTARYGPGISELARDDKTLYILTRRSAETPRQGIAAIDLASGERRQIYQGPPVPVDMNFYFRLSPDGRRLAIRRLDPVDKKIHFGVVSVDGSGYREIHTTSTGTWDGLAWTSDGQSLLFDEREDDRWRIMRLPLNGGAPEPTGLQGTGQLQHPDISPDGRRIALGTLRRPMESWALDNLHAVLQ